MVPRKERAEQSLRQPNTEANRVTVVLNWLEELQELVPTPVMKNASRKSREMVNQRVAGSGVPPAA
jgi:hypothetical protein